MKSHSGFNRTLAPIHMPRVPEKIRIGIDIGGTITKIAVVNDSGNVQRLKTLPTSGERGLEAYLEELLDTLNEFSELKQSAGIGIAAAGFVNPDRTRMFYNPNLPWLEGYPLRQPFEDRFEMPVELEADSNAACLAEFRYGAGRGARRFLCIAIGTGVGGGMIIDGEIVRLAHGGLGDIGHVIVEPGGPPCGSGCHGCGEGVLSIPALESLAGRFLPSPSLSKITDAARSGDVDCLRILEDTGRKLGIAFASQAVITFPDRIALAGGLAEASDFVLGAARDTFQNSVGPFYREGVEILRAKLGWQATVIGAAALTTTAIG
jgi:glucokinase